MAAKNKIKRIFVQPVMIKVIIAACPAALAGIYFFGLRSLILLITISIIAFLCEACFTWKKNKPVSSAIFVTAMLYTLSLPPTIPFWIAGAGIIFAVIFGKMAFGGMGMNIFNPALVGRCFIYISFPAEMTASWLQPVHSAAGGLLKWTSDAVTTATPLDIYKAGNSFSYLKLFAGNSAGSIGETSALLILIGCLYLIIKKSASWQIIAGCFIGGIAASSILHFVDPVSVAGPLFQLFAGGFMFGSVFMATDPVSAAKTIQGKWIYGFLIGALSIVLRGYSNFSCGVMFSILIMNMFSSLIDYIVKNMKKK